MTAILKTVLVSGLLLFFVACGRSTDHKDKRTGNSADNTTFNPADPYIVRGHWEMPMTAGAQNLRSFHSLLGNASSNAPIGATVTAAVTFSVSTANFVEPTNPIDSASYGSLDVTALRDNSLRVCGPNANQKCTTGAIRIYTTGTAGPGLWNTVEQYGLPITSGADTIGLAPAGAYVKATAAIGNKNILKLSDFTVAANIPIPVAVNFADAAAGTYASTMVIEYLVQ